MTNSDANFLRVRIPAARVLSNNPRTPTGNRVFEILERERVDSLSDRCYHYFTPIVFRDDAGPGSGLQGVSAFLRYLFTIDVSTTRRLPILSLSPCLHSPLLVPPKLPSLFFFSSFSLCKYSCPWTKGSRPSAP